MDCRMDTVLVGMKTVLLLHIFIRAQNRDAHLYGVNIPNEVTYSNKTYDFHFLEILANS